MENYELHLTIQAKDLPFAADLLKRRCIKAWHTSNITDDPVLGPGAKGYLTAYAEYLGEAVRMIGGMQVTLAEAGILVLREKIEHIVHDSKTGKRWDDAPTVTHCPIRNDLQPQGWSGAE